MGRRRWRFVPMLGLGGQREGSRAGNEALKHYTVFGGDRQNLVKAKTGRGEVFAYVGLPQNLKDLKARALRCLGGLMETTDGPLSSQAHGEADAWLSGAARARAAGLLRIWLISAREATGRTVQLATFTGRTALPLAVSQNY